MLQMCLTETNEEELVDLKEDCCDQDELVGYMVSFTDGSENYTDLDEIDDVDILL